jgi:hypothetical protein
MSDFWDIGEYKEGDIVDVPLGMRVVYPKRQNRSWLTNFAEKKKKRKEKEVLEEVGDDEGYGDGDDGDGDADGVDYPADDGDGDDGDGDDGNDGEDINDEGDADEDTPSRKIQNGPKYEIQDEWKYKKVPIHTTSSAEELAKNMGLATHHEQLVKIKVRRRIEDVHIVYAGTQRMKVGKHGNLLPIESDKRYISIFDEDDSAGRAALGLISNMPPDTFKPKYSRIEKNPYNNTYTFGDYVRFSSHDGIDREGIVMVYTETSVGVSVKEGVLDSKMIFVNYKDPSLKKAVKSKNQLKLKTVITPDDVYIMTKIPDDIRKTIINTYTDILNNLKSVTGGLDDDLKALSAPRSVVFPVTPSTTKTALKKIMFGDTDGKKHSGPPGRLISWDDYYSNQFYAWIANKYHAFFNSQVSSQKVANIASSTVKQELDPSVLLEEIASELPGGEMKYDTTVQDILNGLKKASDITIFQAMCIQALEKEKYGGHWDVQGTDLATILSGIVQAYYRIHPPDINAYYRYIYDLELESVKRAYVPTDDDTREFDGLHLADLKKLYDAAVIKAELEKDKYYEELKENKLRDRQEFLGRGGGTSTARDIPAKKDLSLENRKQVERFEQIIFASYGSSVHSYLSNVLVPHIFLEGPLAKHAKFFRAKIANGSFEFDALTGANIAHYLPEFAMNKNIPDDRWESAGYVIGAVLHNDMAAIVDMYVNILNPTAHVQHSGLSYTNILTLINGLEELLVDPANECMSDTSTGNRFVISKEGKYVLDPISRKLLDERIPDGDLAICYDPATKAFTCHSTRDVMLSIARGDLSNPHTKKQYPTDFVERIRKRNLSLISNLKQPEDADPLPEVPVPENRLEPMKKPTPVPVLARAIRKRHIHAIKGNFEPISTMLLLGAVELFALFDSSFTFLIEDEDGNVVEQEIPITYDTTDKNIDVAVLTFYPDVPVTIQDLADQAKLIPKGVKKVYIAGLDAKGVIPKNLIIYASRIKKIVPAMKRVFYADTHDEVDMRDILIDVVVDVEGVKAAE